MRKTQPHFQWLIFISFNFKGFIIISVCMSTSCAYLCAHTWKLEEGVGCPFITSRLFA